MGGALRLIDWADEKAIPTYERQENRSNLRIAISHASETFELDYELYQVLMGLCEPWAPLAGMLGDGLEGYMGAGGS